MAANSRALIVGGVIGVLLIGGLVAAFVFLPNSDDGQATNGTPSPTATDVRLEIEQAYLRFWDVWTQANLELDPSLLDEVATGEALAALMESVEGQRARNQPVRIRVEHNYEIVIVDESTASVDDSYINHSQRLDPETMEPIEDDPNVQVRKTHTLRKVNGQWKVAEIIEVQ
jgi:hypothetical protein